jgi:hypothetical protein
MLCKVTLYTAESTFKVRPLFLRRLSDFFFKSESKEPALPSYEKYSQFPDTLLKFPARDKLKTLLQAM